MTDVLLLIAAAAAALLLRLGVLCFSRIKGRSMLPTLNDRDWTLVWRFPYLFGRPHRQDVVICHFPGRYWRGFRFFPLCFVKRVIGLPGETVEMIDGVIHIDGSPLAETYLDPARTRFSRTRPPVTLGPDEYYVLGDNRDASNDSRRVGPIRRRAILGRVHGVFWPLKGMRRIR